MTEHPATRATAFEGSSLLAAGAVADVALAVKAALERGTYEPVLSFDDATGRVIDFDLRGTEAEVVERLSATAASPAPKDQHVGARGRGRPKLGVVGREVTLLPRHWQWLAAQPGGASVALRRLVDAARRVGGDKRRQRDAQERAYRFMSALAGDLPGYEEAIRALFAGDRDRFENQMANWPEDARDYALRLALPDPVNE